ncbi:hypothetical protein [Pseudoflavonifractor intestinihominis]|uniref:DUF5105 domain-containing protein n=1 Tax=Pseudoflavonifractor intestinihominis TaxID=3133171 RepID=A0ABV1EAF6_9FIRM|nr:hypothetical protein [uncultured Pseudoflavonifractor sp.]
MKKLRKLTLLTLALSLVLCLTACGLLGGGVTKQDAVDYVKAQMDVIYKGEYQEYLKLVTDSSEEECQQAYDDKMLNEAQYLMSSLGIEYPTDELTARFAEAYRQIFAKADYTVQEASRMDDGSYSVKVTVRPIDIIDQLNDAYPAFSETFEAKYADVDIDSMTDEAYSDWYVNTYDADYGQGLADLLESLIPSLGYMDETSILVQVQPDEEGYYYLSEDDFTNLDWLVVYYDSLGS